ncbi:MAG: hypothetical protein EZS28_041905 [Streblomastix strix]|uniref:Uncharacterized protein n=1 Tax=Streblomastix strix TaxID=222440 RepID=A0A5J4TWU3_9EUKA|nr:MAG: hypothetical protein EZS28_041905 [Streblomastix strix]
MLNSYECISNATMSPVIDNDDKYAYQGSTTGDIVAFDIQNNCLKHFKLVKDNDKLQSYSFARRSVEQIEEEGGNEEIDVQMNNKGCDGNIKYHANRAKGEILNYFIELSNPKPNWYW